MKTLLQGLIFSISALAFVASGGGLCLPGLYRDSLLYKIMWQANDVITLLLVAPLILSFRNFQHGHQMSNVVWLGLVAFMLYNFSFYLYGAAFNAFFVVYAAIVTLAFYALVIGLIDVSAKIKFTPELRHRRFFAAFLLLVASPLVIVEVGQWVRFIYNNTRPDFPVLILALDLTMVIPTMLVAAVLTLKNHPWGYWLTGIMLVKSFTYGLVLVTGTISVTLRGLRPADPLLPYYVFVMTGGLIFLFIQSGRRISGRNTTI